MTVTTRTGVMGTRVWVKGCVILLAIWVCWSVYDVRYRVAEIEMLRRLESYTDMTLFDQLIESKQFAKQYGWRYIPEFPDD